MHSVWQHRRRLWRVREESAEMGLLFKGGEHLENTRSIDTVVLDKTGTVTKGEPALTDITVTEGFVEDEVLQLIATAENQSEHPLHKRLSKV